MPTRPTIAQRLAEKTQPEPNSGCLLFVGAMHPDGYGCIGDRNQKKWAHRVAWEQAYGPIPKGMLVCHKCDVRCCVNVDHLFLGTPRDNVDDMLQKGRQLSGPKSRGRKLTASDVQFIRSDESKQHTDISLAKAMSVARKCISRVRRGVTWRHV